MGDDYLARRNISLRWFEQIDSWSLRQIIGNPNAEEMLSVTMTCDHPKLKESEWMSS